MIFGCMGRGNGNESPTGHLISRHGPHVLLPFPRRPGHRFWPHCTISQKEGGSRAGTQGFPPEQHPLPAGKGSHVLQLPWSWEQRGLVGCPLSVMRNIWGSSWSCGRNEQQGQPDAAVGRALGSSFHVRGPAGHLCVVAVSLRGLWGHRACGIRDMGTQPQQGGPVPLSGSEHGVGTGCLTPEFCPPPCSSSHPALPPTLLFLPPCSAPHPALPLTLLCPSPQSSSSHPPLPPTLLSPLAVPHNVPPAAHSTSPSRSWVEPVLSTQALAQPEVGSLHKFCS